jgi:MtN3 and saliva related transmembrane protein
MSFVVFGYFAVFFTTVSFLPQAIKTLKTRNVDGLSMLTYLFLFFGSLSWFLYGSYLNDIPLMTTGLILYLIVKEKKSAI